MADPFQNVDAAGDDFIRMFADSMDLRQSDPVMEAIVADYLSRLSNSGGLTVEVGAGAGAVTRRIADDRAPGRVLGFEPSEGFVREARARTGGRRNLSFEVADGADLPLEEGSVQSLVMHTVLTHVTDPTALIAEARRVLEPGGELVICDADFAKASLASFANAPLDSCARLFTEHFVTDAHLVGKLPALLTAAGLETTHFDLRSRLVATSEQMLAWVEVTCDLMLKAGQIGEPLAEGLRSEYRRRMESGQLYGYQAFATAIARKPA